jgi:hypothetical protein
MIEWQLQDCLAVKAIMDYYNTNTTKNERNPIISYPIGVDSKKRNYWQFGGKILLGCIKNVKI